MTETLALSKLQPSPLNPRTVIGDVKELAASIESVGLLEPLLVRQSNGHYEVIAGHRRLKAAGVAGLKEVPVIVREMTDEQVVEAMLVENLQRSDLSPLDEARGYQQLTQYKIARKDIAKRIGRSAAHVGNRIKLLDAPLVAQQALAQGKISIEDCLELVRLKDHPKLAEKVVAKGSYNISYAIQDELRRFEIAEQKKAVTTRLKEAGVKIVKRPDYSDRTTKTLTVLEITPAKHKAEPCHAAYLVDDSNWAKGKSVYSVKEVYVCTDPARHESKGESKVKVSTTAPGKASPTGEHAKVQAEREQAQKDAEAALAARKPFLREIVKKNPKSPEVWTTICFGLLNSEYYGEGLLNELLGVDTDVVIEYEHLLTVARDNPDKMRQVCLAIAIEVFEENVLQPYRTDWSGAKEYFDLLGKHGYTLSKFEQRKLKPVEKRKEPKRKASEEDQGPGEDIPAPERIVEED